MTTFYHHRDPFHNKSGEDLMEDIYKTSRGFTYYGNKMLEYIALEQIVEIKELVGQLDEKTKTFNLFEVKLKEPDKKEPFGHYFIHSDLGIVDDLENNQRIILEAKNDFAKLLRGEGSTIGTKAADATTED